MAFLQQTNVQATAQVAAPKLKLIRSWEELPDFQNEDQESKFWLSSQLDFHLMEESAAEPVELTESVTITLRMDPRMLLRIKRLARQRYLNYQSMIKQWIAERLEQEIKRVSIP